MNTYILFGFIQKLTNKYHGFRIFCPIPKLENQHNEQLAYLAMNNRPLSSDQCVFGPGKKTNENKTFFFLKKSFYNQLYTRHAKE